jgi:hypothetical protein
LGTWWGCQQLDVVSLQRCDSLEEYMNAEGLIYFNYGCSYHQHGKLPMRCSMLTKVSTWCDCLIKELHEAQAEHKPHEEEHNGATTTYINPPLADQSNEIVS